MAKIKVAINGFGRIGRMVYRIGMDNPDLEFVGVNDLTDTKTLAHLLKYDSTQGKFPGTVTHDENSIIANGKKLRVTADRNPAEINWAETPDVVIESTGVFRAKESPKGGYGDHLKNGAKKVILTVPSKDQIVLSIRFMFQMMDPYGLLPTQLIYSFLRNPSIQKNFLSSGS